MTHDNVGIWYGDIPGQPGGATIDYYATAFFTDSTSVSTPIGRYRVLSFNQGGYETTFPPYNFIDITSSGTAIQPIAFFPDGNYDDGTAGPLSLGGEFAFFGQAVSHAWVGANGALGLSAYPTDTIEVNANGFYAPYNIPSADVPRNFVGAYWNDFFLGPGGHGTAYYEIVGSQFILEYYHVGNFNSATDTSTTFEIILDRSDSSITFQYADVGSSGLDYSDLVGLQRDTSDDGWLFLNRLGYPDTTRPRNNFAIKMKYTAPLGLEEKKGIPTTFSLEQNYPNPFNPSTAIHFTLPASALRTSASGHASLFTTLKVYDLLGQEVATLVNEVKQPGTYTVTWDAIGLSSGVYFCRLQAGKFVDTKKLVLLK